MRLSRWVVGVAVVAAGSGVRPAGAEGTGEAQQRNASVRPAPDGPGAQVQQVVIPLDDTGVRDLDYLNPRNPPYLFGEIARGIAACRNTTKAAEVAGIQKEILAALQDRALVKTEAASIPAAAPAYPACPRPSDYATMRLEFVNTTSDRDMRAVLHVVLGAGSGALLARLRSPQPSQPIDLRAEATAKRLLTAEACVPNSQGNRCDYTFNLLRGDAQHLDVADLLWLMGLEGTSDEKAAALLFDVGFLRDDEKPTNARGFFTVVPIDRMQEPLSASKLSVTASLRGTREPALGTDDLPLSISPKVPYDGARRDHFPAVGRVVLEQTLGNRADANVELTFKNGDQGGKDAQPAVAANSYQVNVYSLKGVQIRLGKTDFGKAVSGIAASESGEGFRLSYRKLSVSHLIKKEGKVGVPNDRDVDNSSWIAQLSSVRTPPGFGPLRAFSVLAIAGRDRDPLTDHLYRTVGGDTSFRLGRWRGNLAGYWSWSKPRVPERIEGRGRVGLLTVTRSWVRQANTDPKGSPRHSVALTLGQGTGDRPSTPLNEGYLGETAGFAPDMLFLSSLVKRIDTGGQGALGAGLSNKKYLGLSYTNARFSPLRLIARAIGAEADIQAQSTLVQWHVYKLNEPIGGSRDAGQEVDVKMFIETPPGVIVELSAGRFFPGAATKPLFADKPWSILGTITVKL